MKNNLLIGLLVALALTTGILGTLLVQSHTVEAQGAARFRECFQVSTTRWSHAGNQDHLRRPEGRFRIAEGWTPVGGGPGMLWLCR